MGSKKIKKAKYKGTFLSSSNCKEILPLLPNCMLGTRSRPSRYIYTHIQGQVCVQAYMYHAHMHTYMETHILKR